MGLFEAIELEIIRTKNNIGLLAPSPNRDRYELKMMRTCMNNITKLMDAKKE